MPVGNSKLLLLLDRSSTGACTRPRGARDRLSSGRLSFVPLTTAAAAVKMFCDDRCSKERMTTAVTLDLAFSKIGREKF